MTAVMILLGVVTPNTILAHRQPEQRYIDTVKDKISTSIISEQIPQTQKKFRSMIKKYQNNKPFYDLKIYIPQQLIPEQLKVSIQNQQIHQIDKIFKRKQRVKQFQSNKRLVKYYKLLSDQKTDNLSDQIIKKERTNLIFSFAQVKRLRSQVEIQNFNNFITQIQQQADLTLKLIQINHNIDYQGNLFLDSVQYREILQQISSQQSAERTLIIQKINKKYNYLKNLLIEQKNYYNQKYKLLTAQKNKSKFCIIVQNSPQQIVNKYYYRKLNSIFQQQYSQYHVIIITSSGEQRQKLVDYMKINNIPTQKYIIIQYKNDQKFSQQKQEIIQTVMNNFCAQRQYALILGHYQSFIGRQVLGLYDRIYEQKDEVFLFYSDFLTVQQDNKIMINVGNVQRTAGKSQELSPKQQELPKDIFKNSMVSINLHILKQKIIQIKNNVQLYQKFNKLPFTQKIHKIFKQTHNKHIKQFVSQKRVKYS